MPLPPLLLYRHLSVGLQQYPFACASSSSDCGADRFPFDILSDKVLKRTLKPLLYDIGSSISVKTLDESTVRAARANKSNHF